MALISIEELEKVTPLFRGKAGNAFARFLLHLINVDDIEKLNDRLSTYKGAEFARAVIEAVGAAYSIDGLPRDEALEKFRSRIPEGPFITISNHPIGSLDGLALIDFIGHLRDDYKFMVNELLSRFESLRGSLISVNPNGKLLSAPTATSISGVRQAKLHLEAGGCLGLFPSGAVSDLKLKGGIRIEDRDWQDAVIKLIAKARVPVVPIRFLDRNSAFYYSLGLLDWRIRLLRLCHEVFNKRGKTLRLAIGETISVAEQARYLGDPEGFKAFLRAAVYDMPVPEHFAPRGKE